MTFTTKPCTNCGEPVTRSNAELKKSKTGNVFCSRSCSAKTNNQKFPKRLLEGTCKECGKSIHSNVSYCPLCFRNTLLESMTFKQISGYQYQKNSRIRGHARKKYLNSNLPKCCVICNYAKHFDVCHINDISSFSDDSLVKEINHLNNLVALCKNHHWEFDHDCLDSEDREKLDSYLVGRIGIEPISAA